MSFLRHGEIYRSDVSDPLHPRGGGAPPPDGRPPSRSRRTPPKERPPLIVRDEFPVGYSSAGCSPAEPASASPTGSSMHWGVPAGNGLSANGNLSLISVSQARGALHFRANVRQQCPRVFSRSLTRTAREFSSRAAQSTACYRLRCPCAWWRIFFFIDPRATPAARFAFGAAFLREVRFSFLRSALSVTFFVFISLFSILRTFPPASSSQSEGSSL